MPRNASAAPRLFLILALLATASLGCTRSRNPFAARPSPTPIPSPTATPRRAARPAAAQAATATPTTTADTQPTATATATVAPGDTATATPSPTATEGPTRTPTPTVIPTQPITQTYTVQLGDTLYSLARRYNTSIERIAQANNITNPNDIRVGQVLTIFGQATAEVQHVVVAGDTLFSIAVRYGTSVDSIARANNIVNPSLIFIGQRIRVFPGQVGPGPTQTYMVQGGDTLISIAFRYGTTSQAIALANNLPNPNIIYVGQILRIP